MNEEYSNIKELLDLLGINLVKITTASTNPYMIYKKDRIKNYIVLSKGQKYSIKNDLIYFFKNYDPNWYIMINPESKNKTESAAKKLVASFVDNECMRVQKMINDPAKKLIFKEGNIRYFNLFQNTKYLVDRPTKEGDWSFIHDLIFNLCSQDVEKYDWVINWLKCLYNYPTYRFTTSIIFIGDKGSGKGIFSNMLYTIFDNCSYSANSKDLITNFNAHLLENKLLLLANEVIDMGNKYQFSNDLKEFVTENTISVERKYSDRYTARSYIKLILFSNSRQPIAIEEGDRRYFVCHSKRLKNVKTYDEINRFVEDTEYRKSQINHFCAYLNNCADYEMKRVVSSPPMTPEKKAIIDINMTDFKSIILDILHDDLIPIKKRKNSNNKIEYWIKFSELYDYYHNEDYNSYNMKHLTKKKFASKIDIEGFTKKLKTIDTDTAIYVRVPDKIVRSRDMNVKNKKRADGEIDGY